MKQEAEEAMCALNSAIIEAEELFEERFGNRVSGCVPLKDDKKLVYSKGFFVIGGGRFQDGSIPLDLRIASGTRLGELWEALLDLERGRIAEVRESTRVTLGFIEKVKSTVQPT